MNRENLNEIPTTGGIYRYTNKINGYIYIGSAKNLRKCFVQHRSNLKLNTHHSIHFQNAFNKYGIENFEYDIIELVDDVSLLLDREQYYLDTLLFAQDYINKKSNKFLEIGYNLNPIAKNRLFSKQSQEAIKKSILSNERILPVIQFDFNGNFIGEYISTGEAAKSNNINRNCVYGCCKNTQEYTHKWFFMFKKNYNKEYEEYFNSLKEDPFVPTVWNKGKNIKINKSDSLIVFDRYGRFINTFAFQKDIAKLINCSVSNLSHCKNLKVIKNYYVFDLDYDYMSIIDPIRQEYEFIATLNQVPNKIMMYDNFDNFIGSFDSVQSASEITKLNENSIYNVLCGKRKQIKGFKFKYYDDIV